METIKYPTEVKANKDHICNFCELVIRKGDQYIHSVHKYDDVYQWKSHIHCNELAHKLKMYEDCDEGVTSDHFQETISSAYFDMILSKFEKADVKKYSDIIQQFRSVYFRDKLYYVLNQLNKIESKNTNSI